MSTVHGRPDAVHHRLQHTSTLLVRTIRQPEVQGLPLFVLVDGATQHARYQRLSFLGEIEDVSKARGENA